MEQIIISAVEALGKQVVLDDFPRWISHAEVVLAALKANSDLVKFGVEFHILRVEAEIKFLNAVLDYVKANP